MARTLFLISPTTKEILPYQYNQNDTFSPILIDLQAKGKPSNLVYYNGLQSVPILPHYKIEPFFPRRQSQVIIYVLAQPSQSFPLLSIPAGYILLLLLKWDLQQLIPLYLRTTDTINTIIKYLQNSYQLTVSLIKQQGQSQQDIIEEDMTIGELLPLRQEQILFLLQDQSVILHRFSRLENLPNDIIYEILLQLPVASILTLCQTSRRLAQFCKETFTDEELWRDLVNRDFGMRTKSGAESWKERYRQLSKVPASDLLREGAQIGNMKVVNYAIKHRADPSADNQSAIRLAAENGHIDLVKLLLSDSRVDPSADNQAALRFAATNGHEEIVKLLLSDSRVDPSANNQTALMVAATNGHEEIVKLLLSDSRVDPSTNDQYALISAIARNHIDVVKLLLSDNRIDPSKNNQTALMVAVRIGRLDMVKLLLSDDRVDSSINNNHILIEAILRSHADIVEELLKSPKVRDGYLNAALDTAKNLDDIETVKQIENIILLKEAVPLISEIRKIRQGVTAPFQPVSTDWMELCRKIGNENSLAELREIARKAKITTANNKPLEIANKREICAELAIDFDKKQTERREFLTQCDNDSDILGNYLVNIPTDEIIMGPEPKEGKSKCFTMDELEKLIVDGKGIDPYTREEFPDWFIKIYQDKLKEERKENVHKLKARERKLIRPERIAKRELRNELEKIEEVTPLLPTDKIMNMNIPEIARLIEWLNRISGIILNKRMIIGESTNARRITLLLKELLKQADKNVIGSYMINFFSPQEM